MPHVCSGAKDGSSVGLSDRMKESRVTSVTSQGRTRTRSLESIIRGVGGMEANTWSKLLMRRVSNTERI